jgi:hypothetical protein
MSLVVCYHLIGNKLFLDILGLVRWPQYVPRDLGRSDDRYLVRVNDNRTKSV